MKYNSGLSENEWYIMQVLWEKSSASLRELCDALSEPKYNSLSEFLRII